MNQLIIAALRFFKPLIEWLPVSVAARLGALLGLVYFVFAHETRSRTRTVVDLAFRATRSPAERARIVRSSMVRSVENVVSMIRMLDFDGRDLGGFVKLVGVNKLRTTMERDRGGGAVLVLSRFGQFELASMLIKTFPYLRPGLLVPPEASSGFWRFLKGAERLESCKLFPGDQAATALLDYLADEPLLLGVFADGDHDPAGPPVTLLGQPRRATRLPAVLAARRRMPIHPVFCFREGYGRWRLEIGEEIPVRDKRGRRPARAVARDINAALEAAIVRDPAGWRWPASRG